MDPMPDWLVVLMSMLALFAGFGLYRLGWLHGWRDAGGNVRKESDADNR